MRSARFWGLALSLAGLGACGGDDGAGPVAGEVTLAATITMPQTGALLVRISGPVETITAVGTLRIGSAPIAGGTATRVVITGSIGNGDLLRIRVPDLNGLSGYSVVVEQAASEADFSLLDPAGYSLALRR